MKEPLDPPCLGSGLLQKTKKLVLLEPPTILLAFLHSGNFLSVQTNFSNRKITVNNIKSPLTWGPYSVILPIEESTTPCIYTQNDFAFWRILLGLLIGFSSKLHQGFSSHSCLSERMKAVCKSIHLYGEWCYQHQSIMEMFLDYYPEIYGFNPSVIEKQVGPECF